LYFYSVAQLDLFSQIEEEIQKQNTKVLANDINENKLYFSITEVAQMFTVNASLLRFWEKEFTHIKLRKNKKGDRLYTKQDIEQIGTIYYLTKERRFTLEGTREYLKKEHKTISKEKDLVNQLQELKNVLVEMKRFIV
jgi:DNA-binding transcriptional MerR regulator